MGRARGCDVLLFLANMGKYPSGSKDAVCKTVGYAFVGSNPTLPTLDTPSPIWWNLVDTLVSEASERKARRSSSLLIGMNTMHLWRNLVDAYG